MMRIRRFEDLECWQEARALTRTVYGYTKRADFSKDFRLSGQITGAAISIMNNISEGFDAKSANDFVRFLTYSRRSCSEVQNCLYIALTSNTSARMISKPSTTAAGKPAKSSTASSVT